MIHPSISQQWHSVDDAGKRALIQKAILAEIPLTMELVEDSAWNIDRLAIGLEVTHVYCTTVDQAGMRDLTAGIVATDKAHTYRRRTGSFSQTASLA